MAQVKNEELRKELEEKYQLLSQAATAMELMQESQRKSNDKSSATIAELSQKIKQLEVSWFAVLNWTLSFWPFENYLGWIAFVAKIATIS